MVSIGAFSQKLIEAHSAGDLHIHGLGKRGGYWASWDSSAIIEEYMDSNVNSHKLEKIFSFASKAKLEWSSFQRLSGLESIIKTRIRDFTDLKKSLKSLNFAIAENSGRVLLGFEEQNRDDEYPVLNALLTCLMSHSYQNELLTPVVVFSDDYNWASEKDRFIFDSVNSLGSPIFIHRKDDTRKTVDPWLGGASPGLNTGVLGAVTLNIPRAAFTTVDEDKFFDHLWDLTGLAIEGLETKRSFLDMELKVDRMPMTSLLVDSFDEFFSAIGVTGLNEALLNLIGRGIGSMQGKVIAYKVLEAIQDRLEEHSKETGHRFCLMAEPSEGAAYRLAELDRLSHPKIKVSGIDTPFYTGSTLLPVDYTNDLWDALEHQKKLESFYNGGTIFSIFTEDQISDREGCKTLVRKITEETTIPCFAFSPSVSVNSAGRETRRYERIGYWYKQASDLGAGESEEVRLRKPFDVVSGW